MISDAARAEYDNPANRRRSTRTIGVVVDVVGSHGSIAAQKMLGAPIYDRRRPGHACALDGVADTENGTNIHRGLYDLSEAATEQYEAARTTVANFIKAKPSEIIFTSGTTGSLNLAARLLEQKITAGDEIVLARFEHHANLIPWQEMTKRSGAILKFIES